MRHKELTVNAKVLILMLSLREHSASSSTVFYLLGTRPRAGGSEQELGLSTSLVSQAPSL